jgi:hypothetical protein
MLAIVIIFIMVFLAYSKHSRVKKKIKIKNKSDEKQQWSMRQKFQSLMQRQQAFLKN